MILIVIIVSGGVYFVLYIFLTYGNGSMLMCLICKHVIML